MNEPLLTWFMISKDKDLINIFTPLCLCTLTEYCELSFTKYGTFLRCLVLAKFF